MESLYESLSDEEQELIGMFIDIMRSDDEVSKYVIKNDIDAYYSKISQTKEKE